MRVASIPAVLQVSSLSHACSLSPPLHVPFPTSELHLPSLPCAMNAALLSPGPLSDAGDLGTVDILWLFLISISHVFFGSIPPHTRRVMCST